MNITNILVFGKTGQIGYELGLHPGVTCLPRSAADLTDPAACAALITKTGADAIINAAAYTAVDDAEENEALATQINGHTPSAMARAAAERVLPFIHISTDYVFNGAGSTPIRPNTPTEPINAYGRSKLVGEAGIRAAGGRYLILRTSWVFSARRKNFVKTMLRLAETHNQLDVVCDQIGGPTSAADIAVTCLKLANALRTDPSKSGSHHYCGTPDVSWAGFAREIFAQSGHAVTVNEIPSTDFPTAAKRPRNSRLDCSGLETSFAISRPDWRQSLTAVLKTIKDKT